MSPHREFFNFISSGCEDANKTILLSNVVFIGVVFTLVIIEAHGYVCEQMC